MYTKKLTPDQHRELRQMASRGVKLRRLAKEFGLSGPSSAFRYKWSVPLGGDNETDSKLPDTQPSNNTDNTINA